MPFVNVQKLDNFRRPAEAPNPSLEANAAVAHSTTGLSPVRVSASNFNREEFFCCISGQAILLYNVCTEIYATLIPYL